MTNHKAAITLTTDMKDAEKVTVALLVAVGAADSGRPILTFLTKEAVRLAPDRTAVVVAVAVACVGTKQLPADGLTALAAGVTAVSRNNQPPEKEDTMSHAKAALFVVGLCTIAAGTGAPALAHSQTVQPPGTDPVVSGPISQAWARAHCSSEAPAVVSSASGGVVSFLPVAALCSPVANPGGQIHP